MFEQRRIHKEAAMKVKLIVSALIAAGAIGTSSSAMAAAADLDACCIPGDKDYPKGNGNLGNQGYSSLTQINRGNINRLAPAWMNHVSAAPPANNATGQQTTPLAVDGVIYVDTPNGDVIAVDGATGATKWKWHPTAFNPTGTRRGVSVGDGKVYTLASGNRVVALNKDTGAEVWVVQPQAVAPETTLGNIAKVATTYHDGMVYVGTNDGNRGSIFAVRSSDGQLVWSFYGGARPGSVYTDVNGDTIDAGATWGTLQANCAVTAGATPWMHGAVDPELGMVITTFGNVRSCRSSQDGELRPGDNLFANSLVALDLKTGAFKWHYQSIRHDVWDMDNGHAPVLADVNIGGQTRKVAYYGSKSGHMFAIDRITGKPIVPVQQVEMTQDSRQVNPSTQPFPPGAFIPRCLVWEKLDPNNIPGDPWRAVPNYNGYQPDANGNLVYTEPNYLDPDKPFLTIPASYGANHRKGCMYDTHWDLPVLSTTSQNGGADWSGYSFSQKLQTLYVPYGINPVAHWRGAGGNGQRQAGGYQTGGIAAFDGVTTQLKWNKLTGLDMAHGQGPLTTASDLLFIGQFDGNFVAMDAATGNELWRFQTGAAISSGAITYTVNGEQYVAIFSAGTGIPYGNSVTEGDMLWAFKIGGNFKSASGSQENSTPAPLTIRRPVSGNAVEGSTVNNTVYLARASRTTDNAGARDGTAANAMNPTFMRVPVGTTVTFLNPGASTFPNFPNVLPHCATQYFEGLFNPKLNPGESFQYTFTRAGEYFFNDCTDPRPTGKVVAYLEPQDMPGALKFTPGPLNFTSSCGVFTCVNGVITAHMDVPAGYIPDGEVTLKTPLSETLFQAVSSSAAGGGKLVAQFNKADMDNNIPVGVAVPIRLTVKFLLVGVQKQLWSTVLV
jgi:glucose dehydrogenase/plastocyanin